jgi:hypothetical protein
MEDEYVHKNPQDVVEESFSRLKKKFVDISRNMSLLMVDISN